jgi:putative transposase
MLRKTPLAEGEYYHIYSRGVEKRDIFLDDHDRARFLKLLFVANGKMSYVFRDIQDKSFEAINRGESLTAIGAYVLMPNHFHILIKETKENGITEFMRKLLTGYSSYFNKRHNRVGGLFQSRFKSEHVSRDEHLKYLFAYIHLNPIKLIDGAWREEGLQNKPATKKFLKEYQYSSYRDYIGPSYGAREEGVIVSPEAFPKYFRESHNFSSFIEDWLKYKTP